MTIRMSNSQERPPEAPASKQNGERRNPQTHNASIVLICPDDGRRSLIEKTLETQHAVVENRLAFYPSYEQAAAIANMDCDAFLVELDSDPEAAFAAVEIICARKATATVMVYSAHHNPDLLVRSMRSGAREFLTGTVSGPPLGEALSRAMARRVEQAGQKTQGELSVFWGAKGGAGATTLAANYAIALHHETGGKVALVDLHPQLGDIAVLLGVAPQFTLGDALLDPSRIDAEFVSTLITPHGSGVSVIAAPDAYNSSLPLDGRTLGRLLELIRKQFAHVVVDAGVGLGESAERLFQCAGAIYLVTQMDVPSLRNCQRLIAYLQRKGVENIELVLNRFEARKADFDDERIAKAVGLQPKWKVPNDFAAARRASNTGAPLIWEKSPIGQSLKQMARAACGKPAEQGKRKFSLFGSGD